MLGREVLLRMSSNQDAVGQKRPGEPDADERKRGRFAHPETNSPVISTAFVDPAIALARAKAAAARIGLLGTTNAAQTPGAPVIGVPPSGGPPPPVGSTAHERAIMLAKAQARMIASNLQGLNAPIIPLAAPMTTQAAPPRPREPEKVMLDEHGNLVDEKGNIIEVSRPTSTLRVNDPNRAAVAEPAVKITPKEPEKPKIDNPYLAHTVAEDAVVREDSARARRERRGLNFVDDEDVHRRLEDHERILQFASFKQRGSRHRPIFHKDPNGSGAPSGTTAPTAASITTTSPEATTTTSKSPTTPAKLTKFLSALPIRVRNPPPLIEWWDVPYLPKDRAKLYAVMQKSKTAGLRKQIDVGGAKDAMDIEEKDQDVLGANEIAREENTPMGSEVATPGSIMSPDITSPGLGEDAHTNALRNPHNFSYSELSLAHCRTRELVQHPVPLAGYSEPTLAPALPLMLTKKEQKKLRRATRAERHKFLQDQIRLGLVAPPEPKVRLSNIMRVLKDTSVADPSAIEAKVRAQTEARVKNHEARNQSKKLTPAEKAEKLRKLLTKHDSAGPSAAIFRVEELGPDKKARFKIDMNAKQMFLTGLALIVQAGTELYPENPERSMELTGCNLVYVEGGTKAVNRFVSLMTRRINWNRLEQEKREEMSAHDDDSDYSDTDSEDDEEALNGTIPRLPGKRPTISPGGKCELVWRGTVTRRAFSEFRFEECRTSATARKLLEGKGLAHYWDSVSTSARNRELSRLAKAEQATEAKMYVSILDQPLFASESGNKSEDPQ